MKEQTLVHHQPSVALPPGNTPLVDPIYQSVKYTFDKYEDMERVFSSGASGFVYSRVSNPTTRKLEILLSKMQGTEEGIVYSSGVGAISSLLLSLLQAGDHVVMFFESYRPTRSFVTKVLQRFGVDATLLSVEDKSGIEKAFIRGKTKLVIFESPTNPVLKIADITFICDKARACGALSILDNTFAGFDNHQNAPVDLFLHSLTKFAVGHGDAMGGAVLGKKALIDKIKAESMMIGANLAPEQAASILRGLKTYYLRVEKQRTNAQAIVKWLESEKRITNLSYPGLKNHPGHELAKRQMKDFGSMITFDLVGPAGCVKTFVDELKLFKLAASLGSTESLVAPCDLFFGHGLPEAEKKIARISANTIRLSVGCEDLDDLKADLEASFQKCMG